MITIKPRHNEPIEKTLKRLKRIMDKEGVIQEIRERQYYMKPSEKKRKKSSRARARVRREERERAEGTSDYYNRYNRTI